MSNHLSQRRRSCSGASRPTLSSNSHGVDVHHRGRAQSTCRSRPSAPLEAAASSCSGASRPPCTSTRPCVCHRADTRPQACVNVGRGREGLRWRARNWSRNLAVSTSPSSSPCPTRSSAASGSGGGSTNGISCRTTPPDVAPPPRCSTLTQRPSRPLCCRVGQWQWEAPTAQPADPPRPRSNSAA